MSGGAVFVIRHGDLHGVTARDEVAVLEACSADAGGTVAKLQLYESGLPSASRATNCEAVTYSI